MISAQKSIIGYVYDENSRPYSGANVMLDGNTGVVSDTSGKFVFEDLEVESFDLIVSAVGYKEERINGVVGSESEDIYVMLTPSIEQLDQVTIVGDLAEQVRRSESLSVQKVSKTFLRESVESNLVQTLNKIPGVNTMDVGTGVSKPMIRGLGHYRVVVAQNGVKQEGQQWSNHQGVSIDQHTVGDVEIIKGPASLVYGSDAIGGVINTLPARVPRNSGLSGELNLVGKTNSHWLGASGDVAWRSGDIYVQGALTINSFGDFIIPQVDSFLLPAPASASEASHKVVLGNQLYNTAGRENAVSLVSGIVKPWGRSYFEMSYHGTKTGFFDWQGMKNDSIRGLHQISRRDLKLPFQQVDNISVNHHTKRYFGEDNIEVSLGYQNNHTREFGNLSDRTGNRKEALNKYREKDNLELSLKQHTYSANVFYTRKRSEKMEWKFGSSSQFQFNDKDGYNHILPRYRRYGTGLFITNRYAPSKRWIINSGVRADVTYIDMEEALNPDPDFGQAIFNKELKKTYPGTAFSLGVNYLPSKQTIWKVNVGKSYRVPSVYELGAYGLHRHGGRFEKGDINNNSEVSWQLDMAVEQTWKNLSVQLSPFVNYFTNYLYLTPTPELRPEGQVFLYEQTQAMLWGGEAFVQYQHGKSWSIQSGLEYVYAVNLDLRRALPFTPPLSVKTEASYHPKDTDLLSENKLSLELVSVGAQNYTVPNELNTPGYHSLNFTGMTEVQIGKQEIHLMLKVQNILNSTYYNHTGFYRRLRIPEAGRDIQLFIGIPINED